MRECRISPNTSRGPYIHAKAVIELSICHLFSAKLFAIIERRIHKKVNIKRYPQTKTLLQSPKSEGETDVETIQQQIVKITPELSYSS